MSILDGIKAKPDRVKSHIALVGAIIFTACVGVVWTSTLPVRFATLGETLQDGIEGTATAKNALTDLVSDVQKAQEPDAVPTITETSLEPTFSRESALDKLAEERFDPATATVAPPSSDGSLTPPISSGEATSTDHSLDAATRTSSTTPFSGPRPILIGTTTKHTP